MLELKNSYFIPMVFVFALILTAFPALAEEHTLWEIQDGEERFFLFGSFHYMPEDSYPLPDPIEEAFAQADCLLVEVDISDISMIEHQSLLQELGMYSQDKTLEDEIPADLYEEAIETAEELGLPENEAQLFQPWLLSQTIADLMLQQAGFDAAEGVDLHFLERAHEKDMEIRELESMEMQLELMAGFDLELQKATLEDTLEEDPADTEKGLKKALEAWESGDKDGLKEYFFGEREENPELEEFYWQVFEKRNYDMADEVEAALEDGCLPMVIVGSGHLIGEHGLPRLFSERGYDVEQF